MEDYINKQIEIFTEEKVRIENIKPKKKYRIITDNIKRFYLIELDNLISNLELRLLNANRKDLLVSLVMDNIYTGGLDIPGYDGRESNFSLPTENLMGFDQRLEISIKLINKYNLIQCPTPVMEMERVYLSKHLVAATYNGGYDFDIYDFFKTFKNPIDDVLKNKEYLFLIEPYSEVTWDKKIRKGLEFYCV